MVTEFDMTTGELIDAAAAGGSEDCWITGLSDPWLDTPNLQLVTLETEQPTPTVFPADLAFEPVEAFLCRQQG